MERRSDRSDSLRSEPPVDARTESADPRISLALWLRAGRARRGMSLEHVAKVTKIQPRILEQLEAGKLDGLPAEVFVRGFVRSVARCLGLDERESLRLYAQCGAAAGRATTSSEAGEVAPAARALVEAMADLVPSNAARATPRKMLAVEVIDLAAGSLGGLPAVREPVEPAPIPANGNAVAAVSGESEPTSSVATEPADDRAVESISAAIEEPSRAAAASRAAAQSQAAAPSLPVRESASVAASDAVGAVEPTDAVSDAGDAGDVGDSDDDADPGEITAPGAPLVSSTIVAPSPAAAQAAAGSPGSKKKKGKRAKARYKAKQAQGTPASATPVVPPVTASSTTAADSWAPRTRFPQGSSAPWRKPASVAQAAASLPSLVIDDADPDSAERLMEAREETPRRSFLPPILLDREDRSARQGGLTLAVIILLIAATLTLSYLMRRPSASGDGMTLRAPVATDAARVT